MALSSYAAPSLIDTVPYVCTPIYEYENDTADPIAIEVIQIALDGEQGLNNNPYFRIDILSSLDKIINLFEIDDNGHGGNYAPFTAGGTTY